MKLSQEINNTREMIDGELNRIMVTDDIEEIRDKRVGILFILQHK